MFCLLRQVSNEHHGLFQYDETGGEEDGICNNLRDLSSFKSHSYFLQWEGKVGVVTQERKIVGVIS